MQVKQLCSSAHSPPVVLDGLCIAHVPRPPPQNMSALPASSRAAALQCLQVAISFCHEVVSAFVHLAPQHVGSRVLPSLSGAGVKVASRIAQLYQMKAIFQHELLQAGMAATAEQLPDLAVPLAAAAATASGGPPLAASGSYSVQVCPACSGFARAVSSKQPAAQQPGTQAESGNLQNAFGTPACTLPPTHLSTVRLQMQDAGKDTLTAARLRSLLLRKLRPLSPTALSILPLLPSASPAPYHTRPAATPSAPSAPSLCVDTAMLSAASYLLSDLAAKLAAADSDLRRHFPASAAGNGCATVWRSEAGEHTPGRRTCRSNLVCLVQSWFGCVRCMTMPTALDVLLLWAVAQKHRRRLCRSCCRCFSRCCLESGDTLTQQRRLSANPRTHSRSRRAVVHRAQCRTRCRTRPCLGAARYC